jgi:hypothetical protein
MTTMPVPPTLRERIESYAGTVTNAGSLDVMIRASIAKVIEFIPRPLLSPCVSLLGGIGSGRSVENMKVVGFSNGAREVSEVESYRYMDAGSMYFIATSRDQVYWQSGHMVYSLPEDGDAEVIDYSDVNQDDTELTCLPAQFTESVVLDVALILLGEQLSEVSRVAVALNLALGATIPAVFVPSSTVPSEFVGSGIESPPFFSLAVLAPTADEMNGQFELQVENGHSPTINGVRVDLDDTGTWWQLPYPAEMITNIEQYDYLGRLTQDMWSTIMVDRRFKLIDPASVEYPQSGAFYGNQTKKLVITATVTPSLPKSSIVYPIAIGGLALAWDDINEITGQFDDDVTTGLSQLQTSLGDLQSEVTEQFAPNIEDIELGMAKLSQLKSHMDEYISRADLLLKKIQANSEVDKLNKVKAYELSVERAHNELARFAQEIQGFQAHAQIIIAEHKEQLEQYQIVSTFDLTLYKTKVELYQSLIASEIAVMKANLERWQSDKQISISKYQFDIQAKTEQYKELSTTMQLLEAKFMSFFQPFQKEK